MVFQEITHLSPNFTSAPPHERLGTLVHHSVMNFEATIAHMLNAHSEVSYHVLIGPDGTRCTFVPDEHIAWHAGASTFLGRSRCNDFLLGLSFAGDTYREPLTESQIGSAFEWLNHRWHRYGWSTAVITDHRQVAPGRKDDLNPTEWDRFQRALLQAFP